MQGSFIPDISIAPLQIHYYLRGSPDYSNDTVSELTHLSATGNREWRTCPRYLRGGWGGNRTCNLPDAWHHLSLTTEPPRPTRSGVAVVRPITLSELHLLSLSDSSISLFNAIRLPFADAGLQAIRMGWRNLLRCFITLIKVFIIVCFSRWHSGRRNGRRATGLASLLICSEGGSWDLLRAQNQSPTQLQMAWLLNKSLYTRSNLSNGAHWILNVYSFIHSFEDFYSATSRTYSESLPAQPRLRKRTWETCRPLLSGPLVKSAAQVGGYSSCTAHNR